MDCEPVLAPEVPQGLPWPEGQVDGHGGPAGGSEQTHSTYVQSARARLAPTTVLPVPDGEDGLLRVTRSCSIPLHELEWHFTASGGPGGQHANTSNTKVDLRFDVLNSASLGPRQRARLLERLGPVVRVVASDERSQARNRDLALHRLKERLADALHVDAPRRPTRPTMGSKVRRVEAKRQRGQTKRMRRAGPPDD